MSYSVRTLVSFLLIAAVSIPGAAVVAEAQLQTAAQQRCITGLNKALGKLVKAQHKQISGCIKDATRGRISSAPGTMDACLDPSADERVAKAVSKVARVDARRCGERPDFGYVEAVTASARALAQELEMVTAVFGFNMDSTFAPSSSSSFTAPCHQTIAKTYGRLAQARMRLFLECKEAGLADGSIQSAEDLAEQCYDAIDNDDGARVAKSFGKLAKGYLKRCLGVPKAVSEMFPGECGNSFDFMTCVAAKSRCRSCLTLNQVDNLLFDCEIYDNGDADTSCIDPNADECAGENGGHNCHANATCNDLSFGFSCACNPGFSGDGVNCDDIDECTEGTDDCDINATCTNLVGSFSCVCNAGFSGDGTICDDVDECIGEGGGNDCDVNATCTNIEGSFTCDCNPGWVGPGETCIDRDECSAGTHNCDPLATCTNVPGSFDCDCPSGYGGDGTVCVDFDECAGEGGGNNCHVNASCTNFGGGFSCACLPGYGGDGVTSCTDFNECAGEGGGDNCHTNASCTNTQGSFDCECLPGYGGDGVDCVDFDECQGENGGDNCSVDAICTNEPGSFSCACADGWYGQPVGSVCEPIEVTLTTPQHGIFTQALSLAVAGTVVADPLADVQLTLTAGTDPPVVVPLNANGTFNASVNVDSSIIYNGIKAEVTQLSTGFTIRDRVVVINGESRPFGGLVEQSIGLRITDNGFSSFTSVLKGLLDLDPNTLIPPGTKMAENQCALDTEFGCACAIDATILGAELQEFNVAVDSKTNVIDGVITMDELLVHILIEGVSGAFCPEDCYADFFIPTTTIDGDYALDPDPGDATVIDVNQIDPISIDFEGFTVNYISGGCTDGIFAGFFESAKGDFENQARDGFRDFLEDPDDGGPQDAVIAQAIEDVLGEVELTGPIGEGFGINLSTPIFAIPEDNAGITIATGGIASTLNPAPGAPSFSDTLYLPQTYPFAQLQSQQSPNGVGYDMALVLSDSAFNQVLAAQAESGLLGAELTEVELFPGTGEETLTAGLLTNFFPEFNQLPAALELKLKIVPSLAPALTGATGAGGEIAEFLLSHLLVQIVTADAQETLYGELAIDILMSFDLVVEQGTGNLLPTLGEPDTDNIDVVLLANPLGLQEADLQTTLPDLLAPLVPSLAGALAAFPMPNFLGLQPTAVDVTRTGDFIGIFLTAVPAP